ncbi:MAG TPA: polyphosphate kinase 2 family protein [Thermoanaerobaculia bacterium]|nr:polyphosphate kinase 2 family protein [Thermoanaerobaculia bacterium]
MKTAVRRLRRLARRYRVPPGEKFCVKNHDPGDTAGFHLEKARARELLQAGVEQLTNLQEKLYAQDRWALLLIFQAMDAAGKDGTIKHVFSGVNPQGVEVFSFKTPSAEELNHDYLWREARRLPERGRIGIFNRSYYEEVLAVRVHPDLLNGQRLPGELVTKNIWHERYEDINTFERYLARNGYTIRKFFLHVSSREQKKRLLERLEIQEKNWKFSLADVQERGFWKDYMRAYEEAIGATSTEWAPWHVIPADNKWFTRLAVSAVIVQALDSLDLAYPKVDAARRRQLARIRRGLLET